MAGDKRSTPKRKATTKRCTEDVNPAVQAKRDREAKRRKVAKQELESLKNQLESKCNYVDVLKREIARLQESVPEEDNSVYVEHVEGTLMTRAEDECLDVDPWREEEELQEWMDGHDTTYRAEKDQSTTTALEEFFDHVMEEDFRMRHFTGLDAEMFQRLFSALEPFIISTTQEGNVRQTAFQGKLKIPHHLALFVTLLWLKRYWTHATIAIVLRIPVQYVPKMMKRVMGAFCRFVEDPEVEKAFGCGVRWPSTPEAVAALRKKQEGMLVHGFKADVALDGMHLPVLLGPKRNLDDAGKKEYDELISSLKNPKHNVTATNLIVITDLFGKFLLVDGPRPLSEKSHFPLIKDDIKKAGLRTVADAGFAVDGAGDAAEDLVEASFTVGPSIIRLTKAVLRHGDKCTKEVHDFFYPLYHSTRLASRYRCVVENSIGVARRWEILIRAFRHWAGKWCGPLGSTSVTQAEVVAVVFWLANFCMSYPGKACRPSNWKPFDEDLPEGWVYGYPDNLVSPGQIESRAARFFVPKDGTRGRPATKKAIANLKHIFETEGKVRRITDVADVAVKSKKNPAKKRKSKKKHMSVTESGSSQVTEEGESCDPDEEVVRDTTVTRSGRQATKLSIASLTSIRPLNKRKKPRKGPRQPKEP